MTWQFPTYKIGVELDWENLAKQFTWIEDMKSVMQDPIWHGEGDVFTHTKMVMDELFKNPEFTLLSDQDKHILVAAVLFHDVEKRSTTKFETIDGKERIVSPTHAKKGEFTTRSILYKEIKTPFKIREQIAKLVRLHGFPIWAIDKENPKKEVIYSSQVLNTAHLALLTNSDIKGRISNDKADLLLRVELYKEMCIEEKCFGTQRKFPSNYGRYLFFNKMDSSPDYEPYNDLKFEVIMMCGLPGSGKDTYIQKHLDLPVLSLDAIRRANKIEPTDKKGNGQVIQLGKEKAKEFMRAKQSFVFNATNITTDMRSKWISLFTDYGGRVKIIYLEVPYQQLKKQNHNREYKVPEKVIEKMIRKLEIPTCREAHDVAYVVEE